MVERKLKKVFQSEDIEEALREAKGYYAGITFIERARIFNELITARHFGEESVSRNSIKLMVNLSFLFMLVPEKKSFFKRKTNFVKEGNIFFSIVSHIEDLIGMNMANEIDTTKITFRTFYSSNLEYPSITISDYMNIFKLYDESSKEKYGFSVYDNFWNLIDIMSGKIIWIYLENIFDPTDAKYQSLHNLFIKAKDFQGKLVSLSDVSELMKGKIGIEFSSGIFIPQSTFVLENVFSFLSENSYTDNSKTDLLENYAKQIISNYFGKENVYLSNYDKTGSEQDIIVEYKNKILLIECKSNNFNNIAGYGDAAERSLLEKFEQSIQYGAYQCLRAAEYISNNNPAIYYDSPKKRERVEKLIIENSDSKEVIKLIITLKDFLNLAESANHFLHENFTLRGKTKYFDENEVKNTWIVNIFALEKIFWKFQEKEDFIEYAKYRCSNIQDIESNSSDELVQVGYYISPNYSRFIPRNGMGISIHLGNNFSNWVYEYENYSIEKAVKEWNSDHYSE